jgi:hypothetical protein
MRIDQMYDNHEHVRSVEDNNVRFLAVPKMEIFVELMKEAVELSNRRPKNK